MDHIMHNQHVSTIFRYFKQFYNFSESDSDEEINFDYWKHFLSKDIFTMSCLTCLKQ